MNELSTSLDVQFKYWILQTVAFMITCFLIPKLRVTGPIAAFLGVLAIGFVNAHFWNAAYFYHVPNTLAVGTLMLVLINGLIFFVVVKLLPGIEVYGLFPALVAPIAFSIVSMLVTLYGQDVSFAEAEKVVNHIMHKVSNSIGSSSQGGRLRELGQ